MPFFIYVNLVICFFLICHSATVVAYAFRRSRVPGRFGRRMESVPILAKKNNKNKVTSTANSGTTNSYSLTKAAPRVSTNINIPVRQQIAWAKAYKRLMSSSGVSNKGNTRKFRQEKGPKPIEEEYIEIDYKAAKPPALFIDGYNIIGYINSVEGRNIPLEDARDCLISDLTVLQTATGWFIEVIFDAYKVKAPEKTEIVDSIQVTYTGTDETADNHIERRFQELSKSGFTNMVVATDDNVLRMVAGSVGSGFLSASMLLEELRIAYKGWEDMEEEMETKARFSRPNIGDGVSDEVRAAIAKLKQDAAANAAAAAAATGTASGASVAASASKKPRQSATDYVVPAQTQTMGRRQGGGNSDWDLTVDDVPMPTKVLDSSVSQSPSPSSDTSVSISGSSSGGTGASGKNSNSKRKSRVSSSSSLQGQNQASRGGGGDWQLGKLHRPTVGDAMSDELKKIFERMKQEEEAAAGKA